MGFETFRKRGCKTLLGKYINTCLSLEKRGYLKREDERFILTRKGLMVANDVLDEFVWGEEKWVG